VLASLGVTRSGRLVDALAPLVPVAIGGAALAAMGAWFASPLMPIGIARQLEFTLGLDLDAWVLILGAILLAVLVLFSAALASWFVARRGAPRAARVAMPILRVAPNSVPAAVGLRFAAASGRGVRSIPVRSALGGVAIGVAGVVGVAVFGGSLAQFVDQPFRQGWGWSVGVSGTRTGEATLQDQPEKAASRAQRLAADPDVVAVTQGWFGFQPRIAGRTVTGYAQRFFEGNRGFVIVSGRAPTVGDEVALGAKTMHRVHAGIGRTITIGNKQMRVVGTALFPGTSDGYSLADGALFTDVGAGALRLMTPDGPWNTSFAVQLRTGADRHAALARLAKLDNDVPPAVSVRHSEVEQLRQLDRLPYYLAGFLLLIAVLAVAHALVLTVRRRASDLAVLRTLGCTPRQTWHIVSWQATALAVAGAVIGVPIGMLLGRFVWVRVADAYGIANDPAWPWVVIVAAVPAAVVLSNLIAWWPGRRAARVSPAKVLRTE
jgi:hypothetical protein